MDTSEIVDENYRVSFDADSATVMCSGYFRLRGSEEYAPITQLLSNIASLGLDTICMDVRGLEFLNSSGINTLSKFVLQLRKAGGVTLNINASDQYPWQKKSLRNFQKLLPGTEINYS